MRLAAVLLCVAGGAAGADRRSLAPSLDLRRPPDVVQPLVNHDNHLHVRLPG